MPSGLVEDEEGVGVRSDGGADLGEVFRIAGVSRNGMTMPVPLPSAGQIAPKTRAHAVRWSHGAHGRVPRRAQTRVSVPC